MIFVDTLSLKTCLQVSRLIRKEKLRGKAKCVKVLDPIQNTLRTKLLINAMGFRGVAINEAHFFAGYLRTKGGENIWTAAQTALNQIAFDVANKCISSSKALNALNKKWGQNIILLYFAKYFFRIGGYSGHHTVFKILIVDALSRERVSEKHHLILGLPMGYSQDFFKDIKGTLSLLTYPLREWSFNNIRLYLLLKIVKVWFRHYYKRMVGSFQPKPEFGDVTIPALLLIQEDELSLDRSYRGQPHWLFKDDPPPEFRTLILQSNSELNHEPDWNELERYQVYGVSEKTLYCYSGKHTVLNEINSAVCVLLYPLIFGSSVLSEMSFLLVQLFMKASLLATFGNNENIKAFMTCENQYLNADAMNLLGPHMDIHTISYQYSNMSEVGPIMMTAAETMCTFSSMFHDRWCVNRVKPKSFINIGYPFDSSFRIIGKQARALHEQLTNKGDQFIVSYFDESIQDSSDKYGMISINDNFDEISALAELVIHNPSIVVIIKTQFARNSPEIIFKGNELIESALATGRLVNLLLGTNRNTIFPAEAALASDLVIGHVVGATAGLEAALTGSNCILLNPYNMQGSHIEIFRKADIIYENIDSALNAIKEYRMGKVKYKNLGDWSPIIDQFDPFRDGRSATRLRALLEEKILA